MMCGNKRGFLRGIWLLLLLCVLCMLPAGCDDEQPDGDEALVLGETRTYWDGFVLTPDIKDWEKPDLFEENGKYGFRLRATGEIVVPAEYDGYHAFRDGVGKVRRTVNDGENTRYEWYYVDIRGNVLDYDSISNFWAGTALVAKDGKWGVMNTASQEIVPLIYDEVYPIYVNDEQTGEEMRVVCALRDGKWYWLDLREGYEAEYQPVIEGREYDCLLNLDDMELMLVNDMLLVNGVAQPNGPDFPICALQGVEFDLYDENGKIGRYVAELQPGMYEGELFLGFKEHPYSGYWREEQGAYFALPAGGADPLAFDAAEITDGAAYADTVKAYLTEQGVANTEVEFIGGYTGDLAADGKTGALIAIQDVYRNDWEVWDAMAEEYAGDKRWRRGDNDRLVQQEMGFVNAVLYIPDVTVPLEYHARVSNVWQHFDMDYMTEHIYFIADVDGDGLAECITDNHYYEYRDYGVVEIVE